MVYLSVQSNELPKLKPQSRLLHLCHDASLDTACYRVLPSQSVLSTFRHSLLPS